MNHCYQDILDRIAEPPSWWDESAVPRWSEFSPGEVANIYADEVCLALIECQECSTEFKVAFSQNRMDCYHDARWGLLLDKVENPAETTLKQAMEEAKLEHAVRSGKLHYGDPPNIGCCIAGATMNSVPQRVLEFWRHRTSSIDHLTAWQRVPELEIEIRAEWWDYERLPGR